MNTPFDQLLVYFRAAFEPLEKQLDGFIKEFTKKVSREDEKLEKLNKKIDDLTSDVKLIITIIGLDQRLQALEHSHKTLSKEK